MIKIKKGWYVYKINLTTSEYLIGKLVEQVGDQLVINIIVDKGYPSGCVCSGKYLNMRYVFYPAQNKVGYRVEIAKTYDELVAKIL